MFRATKAVQSNVKKGAARKVANGKKPWQRYPLVTFLECVKKLVLTPNGGLV